MEASDCGGVDGWTGGRAQLNTRAANSLRQSSNGRSNRAADNHSRIGSDERQILAIHIAIFNRAGMIPSSLSQSYC